MIPSIYGDSSLRARPVFELSSGRFLSLQRDAVFLDGEADMCMIPKQVFSGFVCMSDFFSRLSDGRVAEIRVEI